MYFTDKPIEDEEDFYDREQELRQLKEYSLKYSLTLVLGFRRTGKTSLIKVGLKGLKTIYIDMRKFEDKTTITYSNFLRELEKEINRKRGRWRNLMDYLKALKGVKVGELGIEFSLGRERPNLGDILDALNEWAYNEGEKILLVIDEVQELIKMRGYNLLPVFAYSYDNLRNISFVFAGSRIGMVYRYLKTDEEDSPLFGRFMAKVELKPFNEDQSVDFLNRGFKQYGIEIPEDRLREVARRLGGIPGWLALYGLESINARKDALNEVIEKAFKLVSKEFCSFVRERGTKRYVELIKGLKLTGRWSELKRYLEIKEGNRITDAEITKLLTNLVDAGFVEKFNDEYRIVDPILRDNVEKITC